MKTALNNDVAIISNRRSEGASPINGSRDGVNTPTMDFDDWAEDPFTLAKESDVFSSFAGVDEEVVAANSNASTPSFAPSSGQVSRKVSRSPPAAESTSNSGSKSKGRKRSHSERSSQKQASSSVGNSTGSKTAASTKKKSEYIPISRRKKKPKGMPKRPLSAYNLYFQAERTKIIANQQEGNGPRIGFEGLGKIIGKQWRDLSSIDKKDYEKLAKKDSERYRKEMDIYHEMKAKRFEEEDRRAALHTPVLSGIASSTTSVEASSFDANFVKRQASLQMVQVGEGFGNSVLFSHPPESMVSAISSLPTGTASVSYRPVHVEQHISPPRHALEHNSFWDALNSRSGVGAVQGSSPNLHFSQPTSAHRSELLQYDGVGPGQGAAMAAQAPRNNNRPMPPGMEVVLSDRNGIDRKYRVQYTCYSMTRENANKYIESLTGVNSNPPPLPGSVPHRGEYGEWGM